MNPIDIQLATMDLNYTKLKEDWETIKDVLNLDVGYVKLLENELKLRVDHGVERRKDLDKYNAKLDKLERYVRELEELNRD